MWNHAICKILGLKAGCSGMGPPRCLDLLIGRVDRRKLFRGDADGFWLHTARHQHVGMVLRNKPMILGLELRIRCLRRSMEDVVRVVQIAAEMPAF